MGSRPHPCRGPRALAPSRARGGELPGRGVVGRGQPAVARPGNPARAPPRAPAPDPQRDPDALSRSRRELEIGWNGVVVPVVRQRLAFEQRAQHGERLVQSLPALLEGHADRVVVAFRRAGSHRCDQAALREDVDRGQRFRQRDRAAQDGKRQRRSNGQAARALDHARERGRPVEPRRLEDEVVVRRDRGEAALSRGVDGPGQPPSESRSSPSCISGRWTPKSTSRCSQLLTAPRSRLDQRHARSRTAVTELARGLIGAHPVRGRRDAGASSAVRAVERGAGRRPLAAIRAAPNTRPKSTKESAILQ